MINAATIGLCHGADSLASSQEGRGAMTNRDDYEQEPVQNLKLLQIDSPVDRLSYLLKNDRWFFVGVVLGMLAAGYLLYEYLFLGRAWAHELLSITSVAFAQEVDAARLPGETEMKIILIGGMFVIIFLFFLWSLYTVSYSRSFAAIEIAKEGTKLVSGFAVGAVTGFMA